MPKLDGYDPWEWEIAYWIDVRGLDADIARGWTIQRWARNGDLRPLRAAILQGPHWAVLNTLATMIDAGRLIVKPDRGRPKSPEKFARDFVAVLRYANRTTDKSDNAFEQIASALNVSHQSVRQAVTRWRKSNTK